MPGLGTLLNLRVFHLHTILLNHHGHFQPASLSGCNMAGSSYAIYKGPHAIACVTCFEGRSTWNRSDLWPPSLSNCFVTLYPGLPILTAQSHNTAVRYTLYFCVLLLRQTGNPGRPTQSIAPIQHMCTQGTHAVMLLWSHRCFHRDRSYIT